MASCSEIVVDPPARLSCGAQTFRCVLGRGGVSKTKHEGDGATPIGRFQLRRVFFRADKVSAPKTALPLSAIDKAAGWCDDPEHQDYNQLVTLPHPASCETLWRDDDVYDIIAVVGYNDDPVEPGKGSAIFMHIAKEGYVPTEGCVALEIDDLRSVLAACDPETWLRINPETPET